MMQRQLFEFATAKGDTGPCVSGALMQLRWNPTVVDTGNNATLVISALPRQGDTGDGWVVYSRTSGLNANFVASPAMQVSHSDGFDTGALAEVPFVLSGDRLRAKITSTSNIAGRLYAYLKS